MGGIKMDQLELNIVESFRKAKSDIIKLQNQVIELSKNQERILELVKKSKETKIVRVREAPKVKIVNKRPSKTYVASKEGKKFHIRDCIFAKNIKPKRLVKTKSKNAMLNKGYKPCVCVQK